MTFRDLVKELSTGTITFEEICKREGRTNVECSGNIAYDDEDLHEFLKYLGAEIEEYGTGYAVITTDECDYEVPYTYNSNRFDVRHADEIVIIFNGDTIYEV